MTTQTLNYELMPLPKIDVKRVNWWSPERSLIIPTIMSFIAINLGVILGHLIAKALIPVAITVQEAEFSFWAIPLAVDGVIIQTLYYNRRGILAFIKYLILGQEV